MAQEDTRQEEAEVAEVAAERRAPRRTAAQMAIVGVVASILGVALGLAINWFPPAASTQADKIDSLWDVLLIASIPVFVLVTTVIGFSVLNFRMRPGEEGIDRPQPPPPAGRARAPPPPPPTPPRHPRRPPPPPPPPPPWGVVLLPPLRRP